MAHLKANYLIVFCFNPRFYLEPVPYVLLSPLLGRYPRLVLGNKNGAALGSPAVVSLRRSNMVHLKANYSIVFRSTPRVLP
jgi:hypothetical protein